MDGKCTRRDDRSAWVEPMLLARLDGRLWHATSVAGLEGILREGIIRPDATTRHHAAYVRSIGAVSVFDLAEPDSGISIIASHWSHWCRGEIATPYWLEIDRAAVAGQYLDPRETLRRWRKRPEPDGTPETRLIANIEAAHVGPIPIASIIDIVAVDDGRQAELPTRFANWRSR